MVAQAVRGKKSGKRQGFPSEYRKLTPTEKLSWLKGEEAEDLMKRGAILFGQVRAEERRIQASLRKVRPLCPTECRLEEHGRGFPFPPKADDPTCQMRNARVVLNPSIEARVLWPASYLTPEPELATYDVVCKQTQELERKLGLSGSGRSLRSNEDVTTSSPTALALERLEERGGQLIESKLPTECTAVLEAQIERYKAGLPSGLTVNF